MGNREKEPPYTSFAFGAETMPGNYNDSRAPWPQRTERPQIRRRPPRPPIIEVDHAMEAGQ